MDSVDELVKRLTGKGDVGVSLLGFVLAYLLELKFALVAGVAPGTAGSLGAGAALGLKNKVEAVWNRSVATTHRRKVLEKAAKGIKRVDLEPPYPIQLKELRALVVADHQCWSAGLITDDEFEISMKRFVGPYREIHMGIIYKKAAAQAS